MKLLPLFLSVTVLAGCAGAPTRPTTVARGDYGQTQAYATELIEYEMLKHAVPGLGIALVDNQPVVWAQGYHCRYRLCASMESHFGGFR